VLNEVSGPGKDKSCDYTSLEQHFRALKPRRHTIPDPTFSGHMIGGGEDERTEEPIQSTVGMIFVDETLAWCTNHAECRPIYWLSRHERHS
jgi:hypothetical protein